MEFSPNNETPQKPPLGTDKEEIIKVLNDLVANYPSDEIPFEVFEQALSKFTTPRDLGRLNNHPAIVKLDQVLSQFKFPHTSASN